MMCREFKSKEELNKFFEIKSTMIKTEVYPIERRFTNPINKLLTSTITYVVITDEKPF